MEGRAKITVIFDGARSVFNLELFSELSKHYELEVLALANFETFSGFRANYTIKIFEDHQDLPGYMQGLEQELKNSQLVLCFDGQLVLSYQALQVAKKNSIPFFLLTQNATAFPEDLDKKQLALYLHCRKEADMVVALGEQAVFPLQLEGVLSHKRAEIPYFLASHWRFQPEARRRFRNYIGLPEDTIVVGCIELRKVNHVQLALFALQSFIHKHPDLAAKFKLILVNVNDTDRIKYMAAQLGLSKYLLLINQPINGFVRDLLAAVDGMIALPAESSMFDDPNYWMVPARISGLGILKGSIEGQSVLPVEQGVWQFQPTDSQSLADIFSRFTEDFDTNPWLRESRQQRSEAAWKSLAPARERLLSLIKTFIGSESHDPQLVKRSVFSDQLAELMQERSWEAATNLVTLELERDDLSLFDRSELHLKAASIELKRGRLECSFDLYERSLSNYPNNIESLVGMAKVSVLSHADEDALIFFRKALSLDSNRLEALRGIAQIYCRQGMMDDALFWFERYLTIDSDNQQVLVEFAQCCLGCEHRRKAIAVLESLFASAGPMVPVCIKMALGRLYLLDGKFEKGRALVDEALALSRAN